jgi:FMNH2-dependent dimethyl sulfone monooxygenase
LNYAAKHADLLVLAGNTDQIFLDAKSELDRLGKEHGRTDKVGISPWAVSIIRDNEGEAEEEYERLASTVNEAAAIELAADILGNIDSVKKMFDKMGKEEAIRLLGAATVHIHLMGTPDQVAEKIIALKGSSEMDSLLISFPLWSPQELARFTPVLQRLQDAGIWTPPEERNFSW